MWYPENLNLEKTLANVEHVLPARIQEWKLTTCVAEEINKRELENVRKRSRKLEESYKNWINDTRIGSSNRALQADHNRHVGAHGPDQDTMETEMNMSCVTCGYEIHSRTRIRHMERCFNKHESQASFGSVYKTRVEGNQLFCDVYNAQTGTYCKRLECSVPEHGKDPKVGDQEVCGCPLVTIVFDLTGEFCRVAKKRVHTSLLLGKAAQS
ncbi:hypothetical protein LSTR_LSTR006519 [Laodelphax striatellus]|uniref:CXXC-type zinc finger protein 1 n=1 Tax=Laodelphax striatellus TaxID=195883 RepID=A0A482WY24_LAOST|nr:hypothetical protein LSTR_LSTR006519 [Laodelphax striatellus]